jgi:hypothetical protein
MSPMATRPPYAKVGYMAIFNRQPAPKTLCIHCEDRAASPSSVYCAHCTFVVRAEAAAGLQRFARYLEAWAAFDAWCLAHGRDAQPLPSRAAL